MKTTCTLNLDLELLNKQLHDLPEAIALLHETSKSDCSEDIIDSLEGIYNLLTEVYDQADT